MEKIKYEYGKDKNGEHSRQTWIKAFRWRDKSPKPKVIYLKALLKLLKKIGKTYKRQAKIKSTLQRTTKENFRESHKVYIYLMKNNSLKENIFKIGKTSKTLMKEYRIIKCNRCTRKI